MESKINKYFCPMKCEGEKQYDASGSCPVCNMHLVAVGGGKENTNHGQHDHQEHGKHDHHDHGASTKSSGTYYCPMRCEGDKTYEQAGDCPECGMHLVKEVSAVPSGTTYTCSMHPEIKRNNPGSCPICGMELIPETGDIESEEEKVN